MTSRSMRVALGAVVVLLGSPAYAQQSNTPAEPTELNVEAPQESSGDADGFVAKMRRMADELQLEERLNGEIDGWYPRLGGMTRGSGFALGPGIPRCIRSADRCWSTSPRDCRSRATRRRMQRSAGSRRGRIGWSSGPMPATSTSRRKISTAWASASARENETSYELDSTGVSLRGLARPMPWIELGTSVGYLRPRIGSGADSRGTLDRGSVCRYRRARTRPAHPVTCIRRSMRRSIDAIFPGIRQRRRVSDVLWHLGRSRPRHVRPPAA